MQSFEIGEVKKNIDTIVAQIRRAKEIAIHDEDGDVVAHMISSEYYDYLIAASKLAVIRNGMIDLRGTA